LTWQSDKHKTARPARSALWARCVLHTVRCTVSGQSAAGMGMMRLSSLRHEHSTPPSWHLRRRACSVTPCSRRAAPPAPTSLTDLPRRARPRVRYTTPVGAEGGRGEVTHGTMEGPRHLRARCRCSIGRGYRAARAGRLRGDVATGARRARAGLRHPGSAAARALTSGWRGRWRWWAARRRRATWASRGQLHLRGWSQPMG
jgi:hypothetical protein